MNRKRLFPILMSFTTIMIMASCTDQNSIESITEQPQHHETTSAIRNYEEALEIAQNSIKMLESSKSTRSVVSKRRIDLGKSKIYHSARTRSNSSENDTLMYVFNFEDNQGFAIVSAARQTDGLLAVTEKGYYDPEKKSSIKGFNTFMQMAENYVKQASRMKPIEPIDTTGMQSVMIVSDTITQNVGPYVSINWGQGYACGEFCPNGLGGEENICIAQIMSYYEYPTSMSLTYAEADMPSINLNWSEIKSHDILHDVYSCTDTTTHNSIGRLIRQIGEHTQSSYILEADSGYNKTEIGIPTKNAFESLGYTYNSLDFFDFYSAPVIRTHINNHQLLIAHSMNTPSSFEPYSTWIIDGYIYTIITDYEYFRRYVTAPWELVETYGPYETQYNHYNWGYYGINNGYYNQSVANTNQIAIPDTNNNSLYVNGIYVFINAVYH